MLAVYDKRIIATAYCRLLVVSARGAEDTSTGSAVMPPTREGEEDTAVLTHGHVAIRDPDWTRVPQRRRG